MNGAGRRTKGAVAERELCKLLTEHLGESYTRNLEQTRSGGADVAEVGPFALEIKRRETLAIATWWRQACEQAQIAERVPALAYRQSRQPWRFVVPVGVLLGNTAGWWVQPTATVEVGGFVMILREAV